MFNEDLNLKAKEHNNNGFKFNDGHEEMNRCFIGEVKDTIRHADGRVEVKEYRNTIVNSIGKLVACLFKAQAGYSGLQYWAIGSGSDGWDNLNPPVALTSDVGCVNEIGRKAIPTNAIVFLDTNNAVSPTPTNRIQITITFSECECNGIWREFAIFGGNATSTKNSGIAINHKTHAIMVKTDTMVVERQIRFTFN